MSIPSERLSENSQDVKILFESLLKGEELNDYELTILEPYLLEKWRKYVKPERKTNKDFCVSDLQSCIRFLIENKNYKGLLKYCRAFEIMEKLNELGPAPSVTINAVNDIISSISIPIQKKSYVKKLIGIKKDYIEKYKIKKDEVDEYFRQVVDLITLCYVNKSRAEDFKGAPFPYDALERTSLQEK